MRRHEDHCTAKTKRVLEAHVFTDLRQQRLLNAFGALTRAECPKEDVEVRTPRSLRRDERRSGKDRRDDSNWKSVSLEITIATEVDLAEALVAAATIARTRAHARYSGFKVGAALETGDGDVITGCNVENATYGLTLCAERVALVKALSEGHNIFTRIVVVADTENPRHRAGRAASCCGSTAATSK